MSVTVVIEGQKFELSGELTATLVEPPPVDPPPVDPPPVDPPPPGTAGHFETVASTSRFLSMATFGGTMDEIEALAGTSAADWFVGQLQEPASEYLPAVRHELGPDYDPATTQGVRRTAPNRTFWQFALEAPDQLRQRMTYALSQIVVASNAGGNSLSRAPLAFAYYQDCLCRNALGNYRDLLRDVTYSVAMADYLTYLQNFPDDPATGVSPDENYAREIMQLFSIGLVHLNMDGTPVLVDGKPVETYDNDDVMGLARVFTGLSADESWDIPMSRLERIGASQDKPLKIYHEWNSLLEKSFLGVTIPAGSPGGYSIEVALDTLIEHTNTAPFISKQLIQRFVESSPAPEYVERVARAFLAGEFTLPDGTVVGDGRPGDLAATIAAVLFDADALEPSEHGRVREPVLMTAQWARAFGVPAADFASEPRLYSPGFDSLHQSPFQSPSVFNFYRPGYIAPQTESGEAGRVTPELQITTTTTVTQWSNFLETVTFRYRDGYAAELAIADDRDALIERLDLLLNHGSTDEATLQGLQAVWEAHQNQSDQNIVTVMLHMLMTSPAYVVFK